MTYRGHISNGVVVFDEPVRLPEGLLVQVSVGETYDDGMLGPSPTFAESGSWGLLKYAGMAHDLPADASERLDHYLYGSSED